MGKLAASTIQIESMPAMNTKPIMEVPRRVPDAVNDSVRIVDVKDYKEAAHCLAESFLNDDVGKYFLHNKDGNFNGWTDEPRKLHYKIYEYITYAHCLKGLVTTIGPNFDSVALWMPPGKNMDDYWTIFRSGMWRLRYQLDAEGSYRFFQEFLPKLQKAKATALDKDDDNSWYLVYIGTKPEAQKKGYARALIEMVTNQADAEGLKCYLESSHVDNLKYYKKRGFESSSKTPKIFLDRIKGRKPIELDVMVRAPIPSKYETHSAVARKDGIPIPSFNI